MVSLEASRLAIVLNLLTVGAYFYGQRKKISSSSLYTRISGVAVASVIHGSRFYSQEYFKERFSERQLDLIYTLSCAAIIGAAGRYAQIPFKVNALSTSVLAGLQLGSFYASTFYFEEALRKEKLISPLKIPDKVSLDPDRVAQQALNGSRMIYESGNEKTKKAALSYLLHYQHYNAEFIKSENKRLKYPNPLCAPQDLHGYIRTEHNRLFEIVEVWLQKNHSECQTFKTRREGPFGKIKLTTPTLNGILEMLGFTALPKVEDFSEKLPPKRSLEEHIVLVEVMMEDLSRSLEELVQRKINRKIGEIRVKYPKIKFLFIASCPGIDLALAWGGKWEAPNKNNKIECLSLSTIFRKGIYSSIGRMGAIPDRLEVNRFITRGLGQGEWSEDLGSMGIPAALSPLQNEVSWEQWIELIRGTSCEPDFGSELYREALLVWDACFFKRYGLVEFAAPLLHSQVTPWIARDSGVVEWAKAYQNLNEIVMLCLQSFPDRFEELSLDDDVINLLPQCYEGAECHKSVGLFSYGMSSVLSIFNNLFQRTEFNNKPPQVASISQSYFEILQMLDEMNGKKVVSGSYNLIDEIPEFPDVLIADIHPNNASREELFQNDVLGWAKKQLENHPEKNMVLVLDLTLNHLSDSVVQQTLRDLHPFICQGRLEIFGIQSLAKLVQLGADNLSGGLCFYLGKTGESKRHPQFPKSIQSKAQFFTLMQKNFKELTQKYFEMIRESTEATYLKINDLFSSNRVSNVAKIIPNVDSDQVYVAINFTPLLDALKIGNSAKSKERKIREREGYVTRIRKDLLALAGERSLPLTGRQSFGFSFSNMSGVCESIRFSIGVDSLYQDRYIQLLIEYTKALSKSVKEQTFEWKPYTEAIHEANQILFNGKKFESEPICLLEDTLDSEENDTMEDVGSCKVVYDEESFYLVVNEEGKSTIVKPPKILISDGARHFSDAQLFPLFFQINYKGGRSLYIKRECECYVIFGEADFFWFPELGAKEVVDSDSKITVGFTPFRVGLPNGKKFPSNQVYVVCESLGAVPARVDKLGAKANSEIHDKCMQHSLDYEEYSQQPGAILLKFISRKPCLDYSKHLYDLFKSQGFSGVCTYLNNVEVSALPQVHNYGRYSNSTPNQRISEVLAHEVSWAVFRLTHQMCEQIVAIQHLPWKKALIGGMYENIMQATYSRVRERYITINIDKVDLINKFFQTEELYDFFDLNSVEDWIEKVDGYIRDNPNNFVRLNEFFTILVPIFKEKMKTLAYFDKISSVKTLREIASKHDGKGFKAVSEWVEHLENQTIEKAKSNKDFTYYLALYLRYPFSQDQKATLTAAVRDQPEEVRLDWIAKCDFFYGGIPSDVFHRNASGDRDRAAFAKGDEGKIREFFQQIGCKDLLKEKLMSNEIRIDIALRWAVITGDQELFSRIAGFLERHTPSPEAIERSRVYKSLLVPENEDYKKILEFIQ